MPKGPLPVKVCSWPEPLLPSRQSNVPRNSINQSARVARERPLTAGRGLGTAGRGHTVKRGGCRERGGQLASREGGGLSPRPWGPSSLPPFPGAGRAVGSRSGSAGPALFISSVGMQREPRPPLSRCPVAVAPADGVHHARLCSFLLIIPSPALWDDGAFPAARRHPQGSSQGGAATGPGWCHCPAQLHPCPQGHKSVRYLDWGRSPWFGSLPSCPSAALGPAVMFRGSSGHFALVPPLSPGPWLAPVLCHRQVL